MSVADLIVPFVVDTRPPSDCPHCGAPVSAGSYDGVIKYQCGTCYQGKECLGQSAICSEVTDLIVQRAATINGILQACTEIERRAVLAHVQAYWENVFTILMKS